MVPSEAGWVWVVEERKRVKGGEQKLTPRAQARAVTPQCFPSELVTFGPRTSGVGVHVRGANLRVWNVLGKGAPELER